MTAESPCVHLYLSDTAQPQQQPNKSVTWKYNIYYLFLVQICNRSSSFNFYSVPGQTIQ